jgi:hypothetical protein
VVIDSGAERHKTSLQEVKTAQRERKREERVSIMRSRGFLVLLLAMVVSSFPGGCGDSGERGGEGELVRTSRPPGQTDMLLLAQARFVQETDPETGKSRPVPAPAKLTIVQGTGERWEVETLEDPESNVFHKAIIADVDGTGPAMLTIGANAARLKAWRRANGEWQARTLWAPVFGGEQERLRDFEIGDVTGDGRPDVVIATHDLGVVAVLEPAPPGQEWKVHEVDRTESRTFVHEVEIGDVDGDGVVEFFVTPSAPNVLDGTPQPGRILGYRWRENGADRFEVAHFEGAHVKEILVADLEERGHPDLYASIEPERKRGSGGVRVEDPLIIRRYRFDGGRMSETDVATFRDRQCRFLTYGDLTGDGQLELVASTMTAGVWMLRRQDSRWVSELVARDSETAEFEHAAIVLDLDHDGTNELYVVSDNSTQSEGMLRRFLWNGHGFDMEEITPIPPDHITFNVTGGKI